MSAIPVDILIRIQEKRRLVAPPTSRCRGELSVRILNLTRGQTREFAAFLPIHNFIRTDDLEGFVV